TSTKGMERGGPRWGAPTGQFVGQKTNPYEKPNPAKQRSFPIMANNLKPNPADAERAGSLHPPNQEVPMADNKPQMIQAVSESTPMSELTPDVPQSIAKPKGS